VVFEQTADNAGLSHVKSGLSLRVGFVELWPYTQIHHLNDNFSGEPRLASCPLIIMGVEARILRAGCPSSHPINSARVLQD